MSLAEAEIADGVILERDVMVTMRDGVRLATDIYRPARHGAPARRALPVLLGRTPYDKAGIPRTEFSLHEPTKLSRAEVAEYFVRRGYVVVWQDCRGRHASEGEFTKYLSEGTDGYDTMEWITGQHWCDGRIGLMGLSYDAHTQMAAACLNPPGLACMAIDSGGFANAFQCGIRQGGAFELKQATWAYHRATTSRAAEADPLVKAAIEGEDLFGWFRAMPWSAGRSPIRWEPEYEGYLLEQWQNGTFGDYWKQAGIYAAGFYDSFPKVPMILMSSWYDVYVSSTLENYAGLKGDSERPINLIMGPWTHGNRSRSSFGDVDFGPAAPFDGNVGRDWLSYRLAWFDRWLKGSDGPAEPAVRIFLMGGGSGTRTPGGKLDHGGRWLSATDWPLPGSREQVFHLTPDMALSTVPPDAEEAVLSYDFDPANPVPTIGGALTSGEPVFTGGAYDQREDERFFGCRQIGMPLSARLDVLSFETPPLVEDLAVVGPVSIELWVSTDTPDTDFTAKLVDMHPPSADYPTGFAMNLTDGIFRCRYRKGWDAPEPVVAGEVFRIEIQPFATANLFKAGHRLRLDISSSNFPKYDVNPNTGAPEGTGRQRRIAHNAVHISFCHPSRLVLQVLSPDAIPGAIPGAIPE